MDSLLAGRYQLRGHLGRGAMGVVWEAWDGARQVPVALKTLREVDPDGVYRLKQEFRARADIAHPNLVTLYELVADEAEWFLTMELIDGMPFLDWIRGADWQPATRSTASETVDPDRFGTPLGSTTYRAAGGAEGAALDSSWTPPDPPERATPPPPRRTDRRQGSLAPDMDRLRDAFCQLARGVAALHAADRLHRDLKPANVLVTREGRVVLVDFGLAAELHAGETRAERGMAGTAAYMAPEQAMGIPLTPASDWYAVGVMLFEALCGLRPFEGTVARIIADKQVRAAPKPGDHCEGVPEDLDQLATALMARRIPDRPTTQAILDALGAEASRSALPPRVLVGRSRHLRRMQRSWRKALRGDTAVVSVRGPSGMGKSVLAAQFLSELDMPVLTGRCYEREQVPYNAFDDLVDGLAAHLVEGRIVPAVPPDAGALRRVFPGLDRVPALAAVPHPTGSDAQELRVRAFGALAQLLGSLGPLVLHLDDVQWGDEDSLRLLSALVGHRPPLLLVLTYRDDKATPFLDGLPKALAGVPLTDLEVGTLSPREALDHAMQQLGERGDDAMARSIAEESGGNPLFVEELCRRARSGPAGGLDALIAERVAELPEDQGQLVRLIALAGRPTPIRAVARAANLDEPRPVLDLLRAAHLIRTSTDRVEPFHDRIREAVSGEIQGEERARHHGRLAGALELEELPDPDALLRHWRGAGEPERAAPWAVRAADLAMDALAFDTAAAHYDASLTLGTWGPDDRKRLWSRLGEALGLAGRGAEAGRAWLQAAEVAHTSDEATDLERVAAEAFLEGGHTEQGLLVADRVLRSVGLRVARHPRQAVLPLVGLRVRMWWRGLEPTEAAVPTEQDRFRQRVYRSMSRGLALIDFIQSEAFTYRHLLASLDAGDRPEAARGLAGLAATIAAGTPRDRAKVPDLLDRAARLGGDEPEVEAILELSRSMIAFANGEWGGTTEWADAASKTLSTQCRGMQFELTSARLFACWGLLFRGELVELGDRLPGLLRQARDQSNLRLLATGETELHSIVCLARDDLDEARQVLEQCTERTRGRDTFQLPQQSEMLGRAQIYGYAGETDAAWEMMESTWPRLQRSLLLANRFIRLEGWLLRARVALGQYRAHGDRAALAVARTSLKKAGRDPLPWSEALRSMTQATLHHIEGREDEAVKELSTAIPALEEAHLGLYAAAARRRLGEVLGGDDGRALIHAADLWFTSQGVANPTAITRMCIGS